MTEKGICPIQTVFGILGGKWKHRILLELHPGPMRYNQLAASIGTLDEIMDMMLYSHTVG